MSAKKWKRLSTKVLFEHPRITLAEDRVLLPNGKETDYLHFGAYIDYPTIIAVREDGKILVLKEHAYPINEVLLQFPEGKLDEGEDVLAGAAREFQEETGYAPGKLSLIGANLHHHRRSTAKNYVVLVTELSKGTLSLEQEEDITVHWYSEEEIWTLIADGKFIQKNTLAAWSIFQAHKRRFES